MTSKVPDTAERYAIPGDEHLSAKDRQGLVMAWAFSSLGIFLLLDALALIAAAVFSAGFVGWLIGTGVMALMMVVVIAAANAFVSSGGETARHQHGEGSAPYPVPNETSLL